MGETYRVSVRKIVPNDEYDEPVIELVASREQLARFAPGVVAEALGASSLVFGSQQTVTVGGPEITPETVPAPIKVPDGLMDPGQEAPKRKRRSKAEMEAARAQAAQVAPTSAETSADAGVAAEEHDETSGIRPQTANVPAGMTDLRQAGGMAQVGPATVPFNPFAPR